MNKKNLVLFTIFSIALSSCAQSNNETTKQFISSMNNSIENNINNTGTVASTNKHFIDNESMSFEEKLRGDIEDSINMKVNVFPISKALQEEFKRRKNNAIVYWLKDYKSLVSIERKINSGNIYMYTFNPFATNDNTESCALYGYSTCINFVVDIEHSKILFTDINSDSLGLSHSFDSQNIIAYYSEEMAEWSFCGWWLTIKYRGVILAKNDIITKTIHTSESFPDCDNTEKIIRSESVEYMKNGEKITVNQEMQKMFEYLRK